MANIKRRGIAAYVGAGDHITWSINAPGGHAVDVTLELGLYSTGSGYSAVGSVDPQRDPLWVGDGDTGTIVNVDVARSMDVGTVALEGAPSRVRGIFDRQGQVWAGSQPTSSTSQWALVDPGTKQVIDYVKAKSLSTAYDAVWAAPYFYLTRQNGTTYTVERYTSEGLLDVSWAWAGAGAPVGIGFDGTNLLIGSNSTTDGYVSRMTTAGVFVDQLFSVAGVRVGGLTFDGSDIWYGTMSNRNLYKRDYGGGNMGQITRSGAGYSPTMGWIP